MAYAHIIVKGNQSSADYMEALLLLERHGIRYAYVTQDGRIIVGRDQKEARHNVRNAIELGALERGEYDVKTLSELKKHYSN